MCCVLKAGIFAILLLSSDLRYGLDKVLIVL